MFNPALSSAMYFSMASIPSGRVPLLLPYACSFFLIVALALFFIFLFSTVMFPPLLGFVFLWFYVLCFQSVTISLFLFMVLGLAQASSLEPP